MVPPECPGARSLPPAAATRAGCASPADCHCPSAAWPARPPPAPATAAALPATHARVTTAAAAGRHCAKAVGAGHTRTLGTTAMSPTGAPPSRGRRQEEASEPVLRGLHGLQRRHDPSPTPRQPQALQLGLHSNRAHVGANTARPRLPTSWDSRAAPAPLHRVHVYTVSSGSAHMAQRPRVLPSARGPLLGTMGHLSSSFLKWNQRPRVFAC